MAAHYSPRFLIHLDEIEGIPFVEETPDGIEVNDRYFALFWHEYLHYLFALTPAGLHLFVVKVLDLLQPDRLKAPPDLSWWPVLPGQESSGDYHRHRLQVLDGLRRNEETGGWVVPVDGRTVFGSRKREDYEIGVLDCIESSAEAAVELLPAYYRDLAPAPPTAPVYTMLPALGAYYDKSSAEVFRLTWESFFTSPENPPDYVCRILAGFPVQPPAPFRFPATNIPVLQQFLRRAETIQPALRRLDERIITSGYTKKETFDQVFVELVTEIPPPPILLPPEDGIFHLFPTAGSWDTLELHRVINAAPVVAALYPDLTPCPFNDSRYARAGLRCPVPCAGGRWKDADLEKPHCLLGNFRELLDI